MEAQNVKMADIVNDLKKQDAPPPKVSLQVYQQAVPFRFVANAPKELVETKMDEIWAARENNIPPPILAKARKGFRANTPAQELRKRVVTLMGGHDQFYEEAFLKIINDTFRGHDPKPNVEVLSWLSVDHEIKLDGSYNITAIGFFEPDVIWKEEKPKNFKLTMAPMPSNFMDNAVKTQLAAMAAQHKVPEINNDLAITMGYETLAQLEGTVKKQVEDKFTRDREDQSFEAVREFLFEKVKISPIPDSWRIFKAQEAYNNSKNRFKSEADFLKTVGSNDRKSLINYYSQQIAATLAEQIVFRSWAINVVVGDSKLEHLYEYTNQVRKHVLKTMEIDEVEGTSGIKVEAVCE